MTSDERRYLLNSAERLVKLLRMEAPKIIIANEIHLLNGRADRAMSKEMLEVVKTFASEPDAMFSELLKNELSKENDSCK